MTVSVLVVCTGNICRSPMGEQLLREAIEAEGLDAVVDSAGVSAEEHGNPVDRRAAQILRAAGHGVPTGRARQVRRGEMRDHDLVLGMTSAHARSLRRSAESDGADPATVRMWREFDPASPRLADGARESDLDVDDPWYGPASGFELTLAELEAGLPGILEELRRLGA